MDVTVYSSKSYDRQFLVAANHSRHEFKFFDAHLSQATAELAAGSQAICAFVNDQADRAVLTRLSQLGVKLVALRSAGFNNVDLKAACELGIKVARVPAYSPHAVAEHTLALILALNRKIHRAYNRVREGNFALDGLLGFDLYGKTVGIVGTGKIGEIVAQILIGFGCKVIAVDPLPNPRCKAIGVTYVSWSELCAASDIVSVHCPLTPQTHHLVNSGAVAQMKHGVMLVNTSRGAVVDTRAVIAGLKSKAIGSLALDVYEEEGDLFFEDLSDRIIDDDVFARLLTFPNVLITGHQAFFTTEALNNIAQTTIENLTSFQVSGMPKNEVSVEVLAPSA
jgi:D-lactate dehydrogenase